MFNSLQALQAFGAGQAATLQRRQAQRADQQYERGEAARGALSDWMTAPGARAVPGAGPGRSTAAQLVDTATAATPTPVQGGAGQAQGLPNAGPLAGGALPGLVELGIAATSPRDEAFARYARIDPEGAMKARRYEREERHGDVKLSREEIQRHSDINDEQLQILGGVTDQATWDAARAAQARLAQRFGIDPDDVDDLPEVYSPQFVESVRLSALGAKERVDALRNNRKLDWDIEDDEHDNRRADRETDSRITYRSASLDDRRERTRIAREKPVRQPAAARERPPSKSSVVGGILAKQARGERLSPSEQGVLDQHGGVKYPDGTVVEMPNGDTKVVRNGRLVSE